MRVLLLGLIFGLTAFWSVGEDYRQHGILGDRLVVDTTEGTVALSFVAEGAVYVHYQVDGSKQLPGHLLAEDAVPLGVRVEDLGQQLRARSPDGKSQVIIDKSPLTLHFSFNGEAKLSEELGVFVEDALRGFRFRLDDEEKHAGGGQRVLGMDRRGHRLPLYNKTHYGYQDRSEQMYFGLPGTFSNKNYLLMFDNAAKGHLDLGHSEGNILQFDAVGGRTAYLVAMGNNAPEVLEHYTRASGRQPLPPRWALGHLASRFGYRSEAQARDLVQRFQRAEIPLDGIIFDLFWFGADVKGHMGKLTWDRQAFPEPERMIADFAEQGIATLLISEPFILNTTDNWQRGVNAGAFATSIAGDAAEFEMFFGTASLVDVFNQSGRQWFWQHYKRQIEWGVAGFWGDLGEPEMHPQTLVHRFDDGSRATADEVHNGYGHEWAKSLFQGLHQDYPDRRPFALMRSGFAGSQRYGMVPWSGDVSRTWKALKAQIELSLQMSLLGLAYHHSDLGGFVASDHFDPELYVRWLQFGVFQPVFRPHAHESVAPEAVFHGPDVIEKVRSALQWRYRLLPYNYDLARRNNRTGMPLMRPLFFEDPAQFDEDVAFMWGPSLLVVPVVQPGVSKLAVDIPSGIWFDFWDDSPQPSGEQLLTVSADRLPVFVKGGSIVPMAPLHQTTRDYRQNRVSFHYWHHETASPSDYQWYRDDGDSNGYQQGEFAHINLSIAPDDRGISVDLSSAGDYPGEPDATEITLVIHNWTKPALVIGDNHNIDARYDKANGQLSFSVSFGKRPLNIQVQYQ